MSGLIPLGDYYLSFQGIGFSSGTTRRFDVLCGDNPPNITSGYANWTEVKRPLQRSLTVFTGYPPMQMTCELRFGRWDAARGWLTDDRWNLFTGRGDGSGNTEDDIYTLEWFAGANFVSGPSPLVYAWSHSNKGGDTNLIPRGYRNTPWIVKDLQWGKSLRNANGTRTYQDATVTLEHYLNLSRTPAPDTTVRGSYFRSGPGRNTCLLIAGSEGARSPILDHWILANRIRTQSQNNPCKGTGIRLERRSINWPIPGGTAVWVPQHLGL